MLLCLFRPLALVVLVSQVTLLSQVPLVPQENLEEMVRLDTVVLPVRKGNLGREGVIT